MKEKEDQNTAIEVKQETPISEQPAEKSIHEPVIVIDRKAKTECVKKQTHRTRRIQFQPNRH